MNRFPPVNSSAWNRCRASALTVNPVLPLPLPLPLLPGAAVEPVAAARAEVTAATTAGLALPLLPEAVRARLASPEPPPPPRRPPLAELEPASAVFLPLRLAPDIDDAAIAAIDAALWTQRSIKSKNKNRNQLAKRNAM